MLLFLIISWCLHLLNLPSCHFCCESWFHFFLVSLEKYFDMKKNQCKDALDIYKKFLYRMTKLSEFLKVAEVHEHTLFSQENDKYLISFELFCPVCVSQEHAASQYIISTYKIMFFCKETMFCALSSVETSVCDSPSTFPRTHIHAQNNLQKWGGVVVRRSLGSLCSPRSPLYLIPIPS